MIWLAWLLSTASAADDAEAERLRDEIVRMAERNTWPAVDRAYRSLVALDVPMTAIDHLLGGQAAMAAGDPLLAWYRYRRAPPAVPASEPADAEAYESAWREASNIEARYGKVALCVGPKRLPVLVRPEMPFAQQERDAIGRVADAPRTTRCHRGLLPIGAYELDGQLFDVVAGDGWVVVDIGWN
jgi:hypothetical protein